MNADINGGMLDRKRLTISLSTRIPVQDAGRRSRPTATATENIAVIPVILPIGSKAVTAMSKVDFEAEKNYLLAITIAKNLRETGLLTEAEYQEIDTKLRDQYRPKFSVLLSP